MINAFHLVAENCSKGWHVKFSRLPLFFGRLSTSCSSRHIIILLQSSIFFYWYLCMMHHLFHISSLFIPHTKMPVFFFSVKEHPSSFYAHNNPPCKQRSSAATFAFCTFNRFAKERHLYCKMYFKEQISRSKFLLTMLL